LRSGRNLHLGLEPEPMGYFETTDETIQFFQNAIHKTGAEYLIAKHEIGEAEARSILQRRLGVCYDTCHMAVEYESAAENVEELRVHCHVPLYMKHDGAIESTADHISDLLRALKKERPEENGVAHFEIETYTWDVLPPELRRASIAEAVADEFHWFLNCLNLV